MKKELKDLGIMLVIGIVACIGIIGVYGLGTAQAANETVTVTAVRSTDGAPIPGALAVAMDSTKNPWATIGTATTNVGGVAVIAFDDGILGHETGGDDSGHHSLTASGDSNVKVVVTGLGYFDSFFNGGGPATGYFWDAKSVVLSAGTANLVVRMAPNPIAMTAVTLLNGRPTSGKFTVPPSGGTVAMRVTAQNTSRRPVSITLQGVAYGPSVAPSSLGVDKLMSPGPQSIVLRPRQKVRKTFRLKLPANAPGGVTYTMRAEAQGAWIGYGAKEFFFTK